MGFSPRRAGSGKMPIEGYALLHPAGLADIRVNGVNAPFCGGRPAVTMSGLRFLPWVQIQTIRAACVARNTGLSALNPARRPTVCAAMQS